MNELQVIEVKGQRVLTTAQLAESYGTDVKSISKNFTNNKKRYKENKHYIHLKGDELRAFRKIYELPSNINSLYLWTEKGAWLHAKSLNTDEAWDAYEMLVDEYYRVIEQKQHPQDPITLALEAALETRKQVQSIQTEVTEVKSKVEELEENINITSSQAKAIRQKVSEKVYEALGGKNSNAFKHLRQKTYSACWRDFWNYFDINEYRELPRVKFEDAIRFLMAWQPNTVLRLEIEHYNNQLELHLVK